MKTKTILLFGLIILAVSFSGCVGPTDTLPNCENLNGMEKDRCNYDIAMQSRNFEGPRVTEPIKYCDKIQSQDLRDSCYSMLAEDLATCEKIIGVKGREYCYRRIAQSLLDISICERITIEETKNLCYSDFSKTTYDLTVCDKIKKQETKDECKEEWKIAAYNKIDNPEICLNVQGDLRLFGDCYSKITKDLNFCERLLSEEQKQLCYADAANVSGNVSLCEKINANIREAMPLDRCYANVAVFKKDSSLCEKIKQNWTKDETCYIKIAVDLKDSSLCEKITIENLKNKCYRNVAAVNQDILLCDKAGYQKDPCYYDLAPILNDLSLCDKGNYFVNDCYTNIAEKNMEIAICEKIKSLESNDRCRARVYSAIAETEKDSSICEKINANTYEGYKGGYEKGSCYSKVAYAKQDRTICEMINSTSVKIGCYKKLPKTV